jgi:23S rRNA G2069 N7-methylase RlmK/C1962 C5-methylase RlmI
LDISAEAVASARRNAELNRALNVEFQEANVFDALREMDAVGERFDTIVLDPPAFAKNRASVSAAARGYKEINLRAMKLLCAGGMLITCTCSYHMSEKMFLEIIADAARDARRRGPMLGVVSAPPAGSNGHERSLPLELLTDRQREVLFLHYYADLDYTTIAEALGISTGTVGATLSTARRLLRRAVVTEVSS